MEAEARVFCASGESLKSNEHIRGAVTHAHHNTIENRAHHDMPEGREARGSPPIPADDLASQRSVCSTAPHSLEQRNGVVLEQIRKVHEELGSVRTVDVPVIARCEGHSHLLHHADHAILLQHGGAVGVDEATPTAMMVPCPGGRMETKSETPNMPRLEMVKVPVL